MRRNPSTRAVAPGKKGVGMFGRSVAVLVVVALVLPVVVSPARAATPLRMTFTGWGGWAAFVTLDATTWTQTEIGFGQEVTRPDGGSGPSVEVTQLVAAVGPNGDVGDVTVQRTGSFAPETLAFEAARLSSASLTASGDWEVCAAPQWECAPEPVELAATWTAVGPILRSHQTSNEVRVGQTRLGVTSVSTYRFQSATLMLDGTAIENTGDAPFTASLHDGRTSTTTIDFSRPAEASVAAIAATTITSQLSGRVANAYFYQEGPDAYVSTAIIGSTRAYVEDRPPIDDAVFYSAYIEYLDESGMPTSSVSIDGVGPGSLAIAASLATATASARVPVRVCLSPDLEGTPPTCWEAEVDVSASWTAAGGPMHYLHVGTMGIAGVMHYQVRQVTDTRDATVVASVDGTDPGTPVETSIQAVHQGVNALTITR